MGGMKRGNGEGSVFQDRARGRWVAQVKVDGKVRRRFAPTEAAAKRLLRELVRSVDDGLPITSGAITVAGLLDEWEAKVLNARAIEGGTLSRHRWALKILRDDIGGKRLKSLTPDVIEAAFARRAAGGLSKESLRKVRGTLRQAVSWAERRGMVARNVAELVELPAGARESETGRSFTADQARSLLVAARGTPFEAMWTTALVLGLRPGEVAGLAWADVDTERRTIHVWRSLKRTATGVAEIGATKTKQSVRTLDAPLEVLDALARHRTAQAAQRLAVGPSWTDHGLMFTSPTGRPCDPSALRAEFRRVVAGAGIEGRWSPNDLRHSHASLSVDAGRPMELVADQLGHKDLRMLSAVYRHQVRPTIDGGSVMAGVLNG